MKNGKTPSIKPYMWRLFIIFMAVALGAPCASAQKKADDEEAITSRYYASRAENYEKVGSWEAAKHEIDTGLSMYPDNADLLYLNGRYYYYAVGDMERARYNLVKSIQSDDQNFGAKRLMVDIEENSKRFSSAICYINELLEFQPYDRDLWRRKINLYNKIGHTVEADQALVRLARIYPNDSIVKRDMNARTREDWASRLSNTSLDERIGTLESWIDLDNRNIDYYIELVDTYRAVGEFERALGTVNRGLRWFPRNATLVNQAISILTQMGLLNRALAFARENGVGGQVYDNLLREIAYESRMNDPYEANGRLYLKTGDTIALRYLINTSVTRGYYDDAIVFLNEAYRIHGRTPELLLKEYALEKRFGTEKNVQRILKQIYDSKLNIEGLDQEYAEILIELISKEIEQGEYATALSHLDDVIYILSPTDEGWASAVARKISLLGRMKEFDKARQAYYVGVSIDESNAARFASAYEEALGAYLKALIDNEQYTEALNEAENLIRISPDSEVGIRTCINMAQILKKNDLFYKYAAMGFEKFPDQPFFIIKQASALMQQHKPEEAIEILKPRTDDDYLNPQIYAAYAGVTEEWADMLLKERMPKQALERIDRALFYDPTNKELLYLKGLAYEQLKDYAKAYEYQHKNYNPTNAEQAEWYEHMRYLKYRSFANRIDATYTSGFYDSRSDEITTRGHLFSLANVSYTRLTTHNAYTGQVSYKGIDGYQKSAEEYEKGGIGLEFMAQWEHTFNHRWSGMINASYGLRFFNTIGANISASYSADRGWTPSLRLGYRLTPNDYIYTDNDITYGRYHIFLATPSIEKSWERIKTTLTVDVFGLKQLYQPKFSIHYNVGVKGKLFFREDNVSSVTLMAGFGTFPELSFFDQLALRRLTKTNANLGFDIQYLFSSQFYMGVTGTWNTCYNPFQSKEGPLIDSFRNYYSIAVQLHIAF